MAVKVTFDTANRLIIINAGITELDIRVDLYSDTKEDWKSGALDISAVRLNKFILPFRVIGGDDTAPGEIAPLYAYLRGGWRMRPQEANHILNMVNGAILVNEDTTLDPFVNTIGAYNVRIRMYVPVQASLLNPEELVSDIANGVWDAILSGHILSGSAGEAFLLLWDEAGGDRKIDEDTNQEIFYKAGGAEIMRFNLFDIDGNPSHTKVYERVRV